MKCDTKTADLIENIPCLPNIFETAIKSKYLYLNQVVNFDYIYFFTKYA